MTETSLLIKYRPTCWEEVVGQDAVVKSLFNVIKTRSSHAFLFSGPPGTGKTTLARLAALQLGCKSIDRLDVDAATNTGVEEMRAVASGLMYRPLGDGAVKAVIVDEAHMLSKNAWNSMLMVLEEPPDWVYWFLCTTEPTKVPKSIITRCSSYELQSVPTRKLIELLAVVNVEEKLKVPSEVIALCAQEAGGSPRQALSNLTVCATVKTKEEAAELLRTASESPQAIELVRALYRGAKWSELQRIISKLGEVNPESVRHIVRAYGTKIVLGAQKESVAGAALEVLDAFSEPFNSHDGLAPLLIVCGKLTLS